MQRLFSNALKYYRRNGPKATLKRAVAYVSKDRKLIFSEIYKTNLWNDPESRSGYGSTLAATQGIRTHLPLLLAQLNLKNIIDAPCGDFNWMKLVPLSPGMHYAGIDIVPDLIADNTKKYATAQHRFLLADLTTDPLPQGDIVICRDCLFHLSYKEIFMFLKNFLASGTPFLLTTTIKNENDFQNTDIMAGQFRWIDLFAPPFSFPRDVAYRFDDFFRPANRKKCASGAGTRLKLFWMRRLTRSKFSSPHETKAGDANHRLFCFAFPLRRHSGKLSLRPPSVAR